MGITVARRHVAGGIVKNTAMLGGRCGRHYQHQQPRQQERRSHHLQAAAVERTIRTLREEKTSLLWVVKKDQCGIYMLPVILQ